MLPLDTDLLMFIKYFVVITCFVFWLRLGYHWLMRGFRMRDRRFPGED